MSDATVSKLVKSSFQRLFEQYNKAGKPFDINTRPYYSSAAVRFSVVDIATVGLAQRAFALAINQELELFSYGKGNDVSAVNLGARTALDSDTNMATAQRTNGEDFAVEGASLTSRGIRVVYSPAAVVTVPSLNAGAQQVKDALAGLTTIADPGSVVVAAEASSPLVLEDAFWGAIAPKLTLQTQWNRKAVDLLGTADQFPEGGARSYLRANGEPSHHNYFRIPEGYIWQRDGAATDTLFSILAELAQNVVIPITRAEGYQVGGADGALGWPSEIFAEFKLRVEGRAFSEQSKN